ncbi:MAG: hypothetical protein JNM99_20555 [Verrucomicrobiaceae bacterium]|nr:hypothetical protein [Verrucomicrobiaceae bacterium]
MLLPRIKDPHLGAEAMSDDGNVTLVNPYTNKLMFVPGGAGTGDTIPSGLNGFTIKITQMITLKKRFVIQGHFVMALDPKTKWYMGTPGQVIPGGDTRELEAHFNATAKGSVPPNYRFYYDPDKRRMIARPKD